MALPHPGQLLLGGLNEIIGSNDLEKICQKAGIKLKDYSKLHESEFRIEDFFQLICGCISEKFGEKSAKGIIFRAGGVLSRKIRQLWGKEMELDSNEFRFASTQKKISYGIEQFSKILAIKFELLINIEDTKKHWVINLIPDVRKGSHTYCQLVIGIIMEFVNWVGNGNSFTFEENACCSQENKYCSFFINKSPVES